MKKKKAVILALGGVFLGGALLIPALTSTANDNTADLKKEIEALRAEVAELKAEKNPSLNRADYWDPFSEMRQMQTRMNRLFDDSFMRSNFFGLPTVGVPGANLFYEPELDIKDLKDHYEVKLDLPGLDKERIDIQVTEHALTISGERRFEQKDEDHQQGYYRMERSYGSFHRSIPIPDDANAEEVKADYQKGVLKITIGKKVKESGNQEKEGRKIKIT